MATSKPRLDRRIVRSRNAILSAFERLLMDKPLADITVSAIAREANVDRKTFNMRKPLSIGVFVRARF